MSSTKDKSNTFISAASSDVVHDLEKVDKAVVYAKTHNIPPATLAKHLDKWFGRKFSELNPMTELDNYGIEQVLVKYASPEDLRTVKSYYKHALDALVKSKAVNENSPYLPKEVTSPMKLTVSKLKEMVRESVQRTLAEGDFASDLLPGADGKLTDYAKKVQTFVDKTVEEAGELADEGEKLMRSDFTRENPSVGERNRFFLTTIGFLRKMRNTLAQSTLDLRKMLG